MAKKSFFLKPTKPESKKAPPRKGVAPLSGRSSPVLLQKRPAPPEGVRWFDHPAFVPQEPLTPGVWWWVFRRWGDGHSRTHIGFVEGDEEKAVARVRKAWPQYKGNLDLEEYKVVKAV